MRGKAGQGFEPYGSRRDPNGIQNDQRRWTLRTDSCAAAITIFIRVRGIKRRNMGRKALTCQVCICPEGRTGGDKMNFIRTESRDQQVRSAIKQQHNSHESFQRARIHRIRKGELYQIRAVESTKGLIHCRALRADRRAGMCRGACHVVPFAPEHPPPLLGHQKKVREFLGPGVNNRFCCKTPWARSVEK